MTITTEQIREALRDVWPAADLVSEPRPLTGGHWATILHLRLTGTPDQVPVDVVLRVAPQPDMGAKEIAIQSALAEAGAPTPAVHHVGPNGGPIGGMWAVMDLAPGRPLLAGLDGVLAVRNLRRILTRVPAQLADTMSAVHHVDPAPVVHEVRAVAPTVALTVPELVPHLRAGAELASRPDLVDALDALSERMPPQRDEVLCHGDLHPFNILVEGDGVSVLDWTGALVAAPAYDVGLTRLLLRYPPLAVPPALRPLIDAGARLLARRFVNRYHRANPSADLSDLDWYTGLHASRVLVDLARWYSTGDARLADHPSTLVAPGAVAELARITGVRAIQSTPRHLAHALSD